MCVWPCLRVETQCADTGGGGEVLIKRNVIYVREVTHDGGRRGKFQFLTFLIGWIWPFRSLFGECKIMFACVFVHVWCYVCEGEELIGRKSPFT